MLFRWESKVTAENSKHVSFVAEGVMFGKGQSRVACCEIGLGNDSAAEQAINTLKTDYSGHPELCTNLDAINEEYWFTAKYDEAKALYQHVSGNSSDSTLSLTRILKLVVTLCSGRCYVFYNSNARMSLRLLWYCNTCELCRMGKDCLGQKSKAITDSIVDCVNYLSAPKSAPKLLLWSCYRSALVLL